MAAHSVPAPRPSILFATLLLLLIAGAGGIGAAHAHDDGEGRRAGGALAPGVNLRDLIVDFVQSGITLSRPEGGAGHSAHFIGADSPQFDALDGLTNDIGTQITSFPLSSSAGGFTYEFDPSLGVFNRTTNSFGPIYAERAMTVGKGKYNLGMNFSHFSFDSIDGLQLRDGEAYLVFTHEDTNEDGDLIETYWEGDIVTAQLFLKIQTSTTTFVATYGVTDRLDVGVAVPVVEIDIDATATAEVRRLSTGDESPIHQFENGDSSDTFTRSGNAMGIGDIVVRAKLNLAEGDRGGFALAADLRVPTGEERDLLGTGAWQTKGAIIGSFHGESISPHFSLGYAYTSDDLPDEITHFVGFDWAASPRLTVAVDFLGRYIRNTNNVELIDQSYTANVNPDPEGEPELVNAVFPIIGVVEDETRYKAVASLGFKVNVAGNVLLSFNGLLSLNDAGLEDEFTPLVGVDYSF